MSPLLYLLICRIRNGIYRSFKTPVRAFMTVLVGGYLVFAVGSFFGIMAKPLHLKAGELSVDPRVSVALFTIAHLLLLLAVIPPPKYLVTIFTETDIANLYPAPLERWRVLRFFLFSRSFLGIFMFAGLLAVYIPFLLRMMMPSLFSTLDLRSHIGWTLLHVAIVLVALAGLLFWRLTLDVRRELGLIRKYTFRVGMTLFLAAIILPLLYHASTAAAAGLDPLVGLFNGIESLPLAVLLAPFKVLAELFLGRIDFPSIHLWFALLFWLSLCGTGYFALRSQSGLLYEYAYRLATFRGQMMERLRNPVVQFKAKGRASGRILRLPWFVRGLNVRRAGAIFWRDMIVAWRSYGMLLKAFHVIILLGVAASWLGLTWYHVVVKEKAVWAFSAMAMLMVALPFSTVSGVSLATVLRKADVQKPLPISAMETVIMQVLPWTVITCSLTLLPGVAGIILFPRFWYVFLFVLLAGWSFVHTIVSVNFWVVLYNPDQEDTVQRMYASLFGLLLSIVLCTPGGALLVIGKLLHVPLAMILLLVLSTNLAVSWILHYLSARKYVNFVPTE